MCCCLLPNLLCVDGCLLIDVCWLFFAVLCVVRCGRCCILCCMLRGVDRLVLFGAWCLLSVGCGCLVCVACSVAIWAQGTAFAYTPFCFSFFLSYPSSWRNEPRLPLRMGTSNISSMTSWPDPHLRWSSVCPAVSTPHLVRLMLSKLATVCRPYLHRIGSFLVVPYAMLFFTTDASTPSAL